MPRYLDRVARLGCLVCYLKHGASETPAEIHHRRTGTGAGRRASDADVIPLCPHHHRGAEGIHGMGRKAWERWLGKTEVEMVELTREMVECGR